MGKLSTAAKSNLPANVGKVPTLTKRQNEIYEQRRKGMPLSAIREYHDMTQVELHDEMELIKVYNEKVITQFDTNTLIAETSDNIGEAISIVFDQMQFLTDPRDKIKAAKDIVVMQEKMVKIFSDLGMLKTEKKADRKADNAIQIINQINAEEAKHKITRIVNTGLKTELEEPEPLPDDIDLGNIDRSTSL